MKTIIALLIFTSIATAQTDSTYTIPFPEGTGASKGNTIELTVANTSKIATQGVRVSVSNAPNWIKFDTTQQTIKNLTASAEQTATFSFAVDKSAPIGKGQTLAFSITANGQTWTKNIAIKVAAPQTYTLYQNYPNPFNPSTIISYELAKDSRVSLKIYDILGREVMMLADKSQPAGYYQKTLNAQRLASGVYIYRLIASDDQNNHHVFLKKMVILK